MPCARDNRTSVRRYECKIVVIEQQRENLSKLEDVEQDEPGSSLRSKLQVIRYGYKTNSLLVKTFTPLNSNNQYINICGLVLVNFRDDQQILRTFTLLWALRFGNN